MEKLLYKNKAYSIPINKFDSDKLLEDLKEDLDILNEINLMWKNIDYDPKITKFKNKLKADLNLKYKVIIFSESKEAVDYLCKKLNPLFENKVISFSGS